MVDIEKEQEIWKIYPDYPFIEVNQFGEVRTKDRIATDRNGKEYHIKGRVLKQHYDRNGYMRVHLQVNGKQVTLLVHRIVAICFVPNPDNLPEVNHKDNDRSNNVVSNLEWCTRGYNIVYREKHGKACNHPVIAVNPKTGEVIWFESHSEAARQLDVYVENISNVIKGRYNKTGGYWFCDADNTAIEKTRAKFGDRVARKVEELVNNKS